MLDAASEPRSHRWAIAVIEPRLQRLDSTSVTVWVGDGSSGPVALRARVRVDAHLRHHFGARLLGWGEGAPVLELSGYVVADTSASAHRLRWLALPEAREPVTLAQLPDDLVHENGLPPMPRKGGRRTAWVSVEVGDSIRVRTERDRTPLVVAVVDHESGAVRNVAGRDRGGSGPE